MAWFKSAFAWACSPPVAAELLFILALLVMSVGFWMAWEPLGLIVLGSAIVLPMLWHRMRHKPDGE